MISSDYYYGLLKKYLSLFGSLFDNIYVDRLDSAGNVVGSQKVPVEYGPKEKYLARVLDDPNLDRGYSEFVPIMAFETGEIKYASNRAISPTQSIVQKNTGIHSGYDVVAVPVPYDIALRLTILSNRADDGFRIVEQILPYFRPDWTFAANIIKDKLPSYSFNLPIILTDVNYEDVYSDKFEKRRVCTWSIGFLMKVVFFGPVQDDKIIKKVTVNLYTDFPGIAKNPDAIITIEPGLTANGQPTNSANNSIPVYQINEDDNYGYVINISEPYNG